MISLPSRELMNNHMKVSLSCTPILKHALEKVLKCLFSVIVLSPEILGRCSLNLSKRVVAGVRSRGRGHRRD
jgi:hypothetical protein